MKKEKTFNQYVSEINERVSSLSEAEAEGLKILLSKPEIVILKKVLGRGVFSPSPKKRGLAAR